MLEIKGCRKFGNSTATVRMVPRIRRSGKTEVRGLDRSAMIVEGVFSGALPQQKARVESVERKRSNLIMTIFSITQEFEGLAQFDAERVCEQLTGLTCRSVGRVTQLQRGSRDTPSQLNDAYVLYENIEVMTC